MTSSKRSIQFSIMLGGAWIRDGFINTILPAVPSAAILAIVCAVSASLFLRSPGLSQPTPVVCVGDCGGDALITVDELVTLVNIALGNRSVDDCTAGDENGDRRVTVNEVVRAVKGALEGCTSECSASHVTGELPAVVNGSTAGAPNGASGSCGGTSGEKAVSFTAPRTATYVFDTNGSSFDTVVYARADNCTGPEIACNDDAFGLRSSTIRLDIQAGETVFVFVDGEGVLGGDFALTVTELSFDSCSRDSERDLQLGLNFLRGGYLQLANEAFACAVASGSQAARLFLAITSVVSKTVDDPSLRDLALRAGAELSGDSGDICSLHLRLDPNEIPAGAPAGEEFIDAFNEVVLPEIEAALSSLERIGDQTAILFAPRQLPACLMTCGSRECTLRTFGLHPRFPSIPLGNKPVELDQGDILLLRALMETFTGFLEGSAGYDLNIRLRSLLEGSPQEILHTHPLLLALRSTSVLRNARDSFDKAFDLVVRALDVVRSETDDQDDDLIVLEPKDDASVDTISSGLRALRQSLNRQTSIPIDAVSGRAVMVPTADLAPEPLNLSLLFSGHFDSRRPLRGVLPRFDDFGNFDFSNVPDPTFGGIAPAMTQTKIDGFLSGGPPCSTCAVDSDCNAFGFGDYECASCQENCTGQVRRCAVRRSLFTCSDGTF